MKKLLEYYPHHKDYMGMFNEFRPFVTFTNTPLWRSGSVNTDKYGLREQYDSNGEYIDLDEVSKKYDQCNVIIGGSTVFGTDASSDKHTLSFYLNEVNIPCISLGNCGAVSHQELAAFLLYKRKLPKIKNIILFSGLNNCSLSSIDGSLFYPEHGAVFFEDIMAKELYHQYEGFTASTFILSKFEYYRAIEKRFKRSALFRHLIHIFYRNKIKNPPKFVLRSYEEKQEMMNSFLANEFETWSWIQKASGAQIHYIIQPVVGWTHKPLAKGEQALIDEYHEHYPAVKQYANDAAFGKYKAFLRNLCMERNFQFLDSNEWLNGTEMVSEEIFTDICHLSDRGNEFLASKIREHINLN
ncbi:MAG: hypothetical protein ACHQRM_05320 [Bacteroidia bacterium]